MARTSTKHGAIGVQLSDSHPGMISLRCHAPDGSLVSKAPSPYHAMSVSQARWLGKELLHLADRAHLVVGETVLLPDGMAGQVVGFHPDTFDTVYVRRRHGENALYTYNRKELRRA